MIGRLGAAALLTVVLAGCGGTEVRGFVREEGTGEPLRGATVKVGDETARTDESGFFELETDVGQASRLEVEAPGYEPKVVNVAADADLDTIISDVELAKESQERQQARQQFDEAERMIEEAEQKVEQAERKLYEARRDFEQQGATGRQSGGGVYTPEERIDRPEGFQRQ